MINIRNNFDLSKITWFKVGGLAKNFVKANNIEELQEAVKIFPNFIILGNTSNVLISDQDITECIIKLGPDFGKVIQISETSFEVGASCLDTTLAKFMQSSGVSGMEFLCTIPGSLGGNIAMNAGCFGGEIFDVLQSIKILTSEGKIREIPAKEIPHSYRSVTLPKGCIVISAILNGVISTPEKIQNIMDDFFKKRLDAQPSNVRTGGSTFKNPDGFSAWKLIRETNSHTLKIGGAEVSEKHSNFLINTGTATAQDIYKLGELIRKRVYEKTGVILEWEIKTIGQFSESF